MSRTLFISDLHLDRERPVVEKLFQDFLAKAPQDLDALYILGDLFEFWIGDDDPEQRHQDSLAAIRRLSDRGVPVYFICGNRDFLVGSGFVEQSGCTLLDDEHVIDLYGKRVLIMHGDTLCTDDTEYQKLRIMMRNPAWQEQFLAQPYEVRLQQVLGLRKQSAEATAAKDEEITDVNQVSVTEAMKRHSVDTLIHGHTHRPDRHAVDIDGHQGERIVLGDWYEQGSVLECTPDRCTLSSLEFPQSQG